jgi:hypothetical protein
MRLDISTEERRANRPGRLASLEGELQIAWYEQLIYHMTYDLNTKSEVHVQSVSGTQVEP